MHIKGTFAKHLREHLREHLSGKDVALHPWVKKKDIQHGTAVDLCSPRVTVFACHDFCSLLLVASTA